MLAGSILAGSTVTDSIPAGSIPAGVDLAQASAGRLPALPAALPASGCTIPV